MTTSMPEPSPAPPAAESGAAPRDPAAYARARLSPAFWLLIGFGLLCVVAGFFVARLGPRLLPAPAPAGASAAASPAVGSIDARLADIQSRLAADDRARAEPTLAPGATAEFAALGRRVEHLEQGQQRALDSAAAALAVAALDQAAQGSRPFTGAFAAAERFLPASADARRLGELAAGGAPSRAALAAAFPDVAAHIAAAAHAGAEGGGWWARLSRAMAAVVTVRRVDSQSGPGLDAVLARAQAKVDDGDLEGALTELAALPPAGAGAAADWRRRAERRVEVERRLDAVRVMALQTLASDRPRIGAVP